MRTPHGLPTASRVELTHKCAASHALPVVDSAFESGATGTRRHVVFDAWIQRADHHVALTQPEVAWLSGFDDSHRETLKGAQSEVALAWDNKTGAGRVLGLHLERAYEGALSSEYVGTADFLRVDDAGVLVVDLKTGLSEVTEPARNGQLRLLALAAARSHGKDSARVGVLHAPEGRLPWWEWADFDAFELEVIATELRDTAKRVAWAQKAVAAERTPSLRVGEHCNWCPARHGCPARVSMARAMATSPDDYAATLKHGLEDDGIAAAALERVKAAKRVVDDAFAALYARAKERPIPLGDGTVWGPVDSEREVIDAEKAWPVLVSMLGVDVARAAMSLETSKAGVERAMRVVYEEKKRAGEKVTIKALVTEAMAAIRSAGAIEMKTRTSYEAHAPRLPDAA